MNINNIISNGEKYIYDLYLKKRVFISNINHKKVGSAFINNKISTESLVGVNGYGYDHIGREHLNKLYAEIFKGESAIVSNHFLSGTHTIYTALKGILLKSMKVLSLTGSVYDTLKNAIEHTSSIISARNIKWDNFDYEDNFDILLDYLKNENLDYDVYYLQRSPGYSCRHGVSIDIMKLIFKIIKKKNPSAIIIVDNCYGEFVEEREPLEVGADLICGSLIKNPGGTIAQSGGYIVGKDKLIREIEFEYSVPGIGQEIGAIDGNTNQLLFQGLYLSPKIIDESILTSVYFRYIMNEIGKKTIPLYNEAPSDLVSIVKFNEKKEMIAFIQGVQKNSPVNSFITPIPGKIPGYSSDIIMASGSFISGSSSELSMDGPIKKPYYAFLQGGTSFQYSKIIIDKLVKELYN